MVSKYEEVKQNIISDINLGKFKPGDKIYSEGELKKKYGYSNTTIVKALNDLVKDGYLIRRQGEGTFVRRNFIHKSVYFSERSPLSNRNEQEKAALEKTETILAEVVTNLEISKKLGECDSESTLVHIIQVGYVDTTIWKVQSRYILFSRLRDDNSFERIKNGKSLTNELVGIGDRHELPINMSLELINRKLLKESLPTLDETKKFYQDNESDSFKVTRITYNRNKEPIEYSESFINPDYYSIEISSL